MKEKIDLNKLGARIRAVRKERQMEQAEFAAKIGVTGNSVARWERGELKMSLDSLYRIKKTFNVNLDDLLP